MSLQVVRDQSFAPSWQAGWGRLEWGRGAGFQVSLHRDEPGGRIFAARAGAGYQVCPHRDKPGGRTSRLRGCWIPSFSPTGTSSVEELRGCAGAGYQVSPPLRRARWKNFADARVLDIKFLPHRDEPGGRTSRLRGCWIPSFSPPGRARWKNIRG